MATYYPRRKTTIEEIGAQLDSIPKAERDAHYAQLRRLLDSDVWNNYTGNYKSPERRLEEAQRREEEERGIAAAKQRRRDEAEKRHHDEVSGAGCDTIVLESDASSVTPIESGFEAKVKSVSDVLWEIGKQGNTIELVSELKVQKDKMIRHCGGLKMWVSRDLFYYYCAVLDEAHVILRR